MLIKNINSLFWILLLGLNIAEGLYAPSGSFSISRIHYDGGGDWYSDKSSIPNLLEFV